jgi:hypothetical protein
VRAVRPYRLALERQAALINPLLPDIERAGFPGYWWVIDQCEYASDVLFTDRAALERNVSMIMRQALVQFKLGSSGSL